MQEENPETQKMIASLSALALKAKAENKPLILATPEGVVIAGDFGNGKIFIEETLMLVWATLGKIAAISGISSRTLAQIVLQSIERMEAENE